MRVRALDIDHEWQFGKGKNDYLVNQKAIVQNINTRLYSFLGNCFFDQGAGIDWFNLLGEKDQLAINLSVSAVILNTDGVLALNQLSAVLDSVRNLRIVYEVLTVYSISKSNFDVNIDEFG